MKPLNIEPIIDQAVEHLSGGELQVSVYTLILVVFIIDHLCSNLIVLQRVALVLCLGQPAQIYLIDEPSAYLDSEQRVVAGKVIKKFILHAKKTAFIVEHDFIMATYLADRVVVYTGTPAG